MDGACSYYGHRREIPPLSYGNGPTGKKRKTERKRERDKEKKQTT